MLTGVMDGKVAQALTPGDYWQVTSSATPPNPRVAGSWASTTKFTDVGVNDHTTFEEIVDAAATTQYIHGLRVYASSQAIASGTCAIGYSETGDGVVYYDNGSSWVNWTTLVPPGHIAGFSWEDLTFNPADQTTQYICLSGRDVKGIGLGPWTFKIGDFRVS